MRDVSPASPTIGTTVDWEFAATVGTKLTRPEPPATDYTRRQAIEQLLKLLRRHVVVKIVVHLHGRRPRTRPNALHFFE